MKKALFAAGAALVASAAQANLLANGSFEQNADGLVNPGVSFYTLAGGRTFINNWTVTGNSIDYVNQYWQASNGYWSLDLSGNAPGGISQTVNLAPGVYGLSFDLSGNPDGGPMTKEMLVSWGSGSEDFSYTTGSNTHANMMYQTMGTMFEWAGGNMTLSFATDTTFGGQNTPYGPVLDNVDLTSYSTTPSPAAALPMIVGVVGLIKRRRS